MNKNSFDFISIGDVTTDAFIRLKEASVHCDINHEECTITMKFADKVPYEAVYVVRAVGNNANATVAARRLGLSSTLVSNIGDDPNGREILAALETERIPTQFITAHPGKQTNYHYVLWYEDDRTILVKHESYPYTLPDISSTSWVYLSSMGEHALAFHQTIADYLEDHPEIKIAFQPGTFQMKFGIETLKRIYARTEVFLCNKEEYQRVLGLPDEHDPQVLMEKMRHYGPKITVLTEGRDGAYVSDGTTTWFMPIYPDPKPPFERTGAGDAFSSTFVSALALGKSIEEALMWAPVNSMSVVQYVGAREGLLTREQIEAYLKTAPADYTPRQV